MGFQLVGTKIESEHLNVYVIYLSIIDEYRFEHILFDKKNNIDTISPFFLG